MAVLTSTFLASFLGDISTLISQSQSSTPSNIASISTSPAENIFDGDGAAFLNVVGDSDCGRSFRFTGVVGVRAAVELDVLFLMGEGVGGAQNQSSG